MISWAFSSPVAAEHERFLFFVIWQLDGRFSTNQIFWKKGTEKRDEFSCFHEGKYMMCNNVYGGGTWTMSKVSQQNMSKESLHLLARLLLKALPGTICSPAAVHMMWMKTGFSRSECLIHLPRLHFWCSRSHSRQSLTGLWRHSTKCVFSQLLCFCLIRTAQMNPWSSAERETVWNNRSLRCKMKVKWLKHDDCVFRDVTINENIFWSFELCILLLIFNVTLLNFFCEQSRKQKVIWCDYQIWVKSWMKGNNQMLGLYVSNFVLQLHDV